jgi:hypothetical protein
LYFLTDEYSTGIEVSQFFEVLGSGSAGEIADETDGGDDSEFEKKQEVKHLLSGCLYGTEIPIIVTWKQIVLNLNIKY